MSLSRYRADLHIHTCLSPCGDLDMSPRKVVDIALARGLDIIAVCDHNTAENLPAVRGAAVSRGGMPYVIAGMEVCSAEEIHLLALFDSLDEVLKLQELVYAHLPSLQNCPEIFGEQVVVNEHDEVEGFNDRPLITATTITLDNLTASIHDLNGLALASHVDRASFGLLSRLGFIPRGLKLDGYEISPHCDLDRFLDLFPDMANRPLIRGSDAHMTSDLGRAWTDFLMEKAAISELGLALRGSRGRKILGMS